MASGINRALNNAKTSAEDKRLNRDQQSGIAKAKQDYANAKNQAQRDAAHAAAERIRNQAGYSSDAYGYTKSNSGSSSRNSGGSGSSGGSGITRTSSGGIDKVASNAGYSTFADFGEDVSSQINAINRNNNGLNSNIGVRNVGADGRAPIDSVVGDYIVTNDGKNIYRLTGKNADGSWQKEEITGVKGDAAGTANAIIANANNRNAQAGSMAWMQELPPNYQDFLNAALEMQPQVDTSALERISANQDDILDILNDATRSKYDALKNDYDTLSNQYGDNLYNLQNLMLDASKRTRGTAGVTGATTGVGAASDILAMLGLSQEATASNTALMQEGQKLYTDREAELANNTNTARQAANDANTNIQNLLNNIFGSQTQYGASALTSLAQMLYGDATANATKYSADKNYAANVYSSDANVKAQQLATMLGGASSYTRNTGSKTPEKSQVQQDLAAINEALKAGGMNGAKIFGAQLGYSGDTLLNALNDPTSPLYANWLSSGGDNYLNKPGNANSTGTQKPKTLTQNDLAKLRSSWSL